MSSRTCWTRASTSTQMVDWKTLLTSLVNYTLFVASTEYRILEIIFQFDVSFGERKIIICPKNKRELWLKE